MDPNQNESEQLEEFINMINSSCKTVQFEGLVGIRRLTAEEDCNFFFPLFHSFTCFPLGQVQEEVSEPGILSKLLEMMTWDDESQFQVKLNS